MKGQFWGMLEQVGHSDYKSLGGRKLSEGPDAKSLVSLSLVLFLISSQPSLFKKNLKESQPPPMNLPKGLSTGHRSYETLLEALYWKPLVSHK